MTYNLYLFDKGAVNREYSFDSAAVRYAANGKGFGDSAVLLCDNRTFKDLGSVMIALFDFAVYLYGITDRNNGFVSSQAILSDKFKCIHFSILLFYFSDIHSHGYYPVTEDCPPGNNFILPFPSQGMRQRRPRIRTALL